MDNKKTGINQIYTKANFVAWKQTENGTKLEKFGYFWVKDKLSKFEVETLTIKLKLNDDIKNIFCSSMYMINSVSYTEPPLNTKINTIYKEEDIIDRYFVKTEREFDEDYGINWRFLLKNTWSLQMYELMGKEIESPIIDKNNNLTIHYNNNKYYLSDDMYKVVNIQNKEYDTEYYIKSYDQLTLEYGLGWIEEIQISTKYNIQELLGKKIENPIIKDNRLTIERNNESYHISPKLYFTKKIPKQKKTIDDLIEQWEKKNNFKLNDNMKYYVKTENEFIDEFGKDWRKCLERRWSPEMDIIFGAELKGVDYLKGFHQHYTPTKNTVFLSNDMIKHVNENELVYDTKVDLMVKCNEKSHYSHLWLYNRVDRDEVERLLNSSELKYSMMSKYGIGYEFKICKVVYELNRPKNEHYKMFYTDSSITLTEQPKKNKNGISLSELSNLSDTELENIKDIIDELLFKRKYEFTDDEYEFYLENDNMIKPENVKSFLIKNKEDKFKMKKNKIRMILNEKGI